MKKDVIYLIKTISDKLAVIGNEDMARFGLTFTQSRVLANLQMAGGEMTQKELERALGVSHPTVVGLVSRMKKQGFLETRQDERDRRNKIVALTDKARSVGEKLDQAVEKNNKMVLDGLTKKQIEALNDTLSTIADNLSRR